MVPEARLGLNKVPRRVALVLVNAEAFQGDISKNPFHFETASLRNITLSAGGQIIPHRPYELDYANNFYLRAYLALVDGMGLTTGLGGSGIGITPDMFKNGSTIYLFDVDGGNTDAAADFSLVRMGDSSISLEFASDTPANGLYIVLIAEGDGMIQITADREAIVDSLA